MSDGEQMTRFKVALLGWGLVTLAYGIALRQSWLPRQPVALASMVAVGLAGCAVAAGLTAVQVVRRRVARARGVAAVGALGGLVLAGGAGLANWAWSLQGALLLTEGDTVPLSMTSHYAGFEAGPLSNLAELAGTLELTRLTLAPGGPDAFTPVSQVVVHPGQGSALPLELSPRVPAAVGPLRLHQGAFGFSPRIVITRAERTLFDERVPFHTRLTAANTPSFEGAFTVEREALVITGVVDLSSLDERMRGHVRLGLDVTRDGAPLGRGELSPGSFADLGDGYRVGFVGLSKWSEIVLSRRTYRTPVLVGLALAALGSVAWLAAAVAGRRRSP